MAGLMRSRLTVDDLVVGIALGELGYSTFWQWLLTIDGFGHLVERGQVATVTGAYIADAHNGLVAEARQNHPNAKAMLWLEHDHRFPRDLIRRLLYQVANFDVLGALYFQRSFPHEACGYQVAEEDDSLLRRLTPGEVAGVLQATEPVPVGVVGMGCTLVRMQVYDELLKRDIPWHAVPTHSGSAFGKIDSDDAWFCRQAARAGFKVGFAGGLEIPHMVMSEVNSRVYFKIQSDLAAQERTEKEKEAVEA